MTEVMQGNGVDSEGADEVSIKSLLDRVRSTKGPNDNLATAITNLNKREARNFTRLENEMNNLGHTFIRTLSTKIDEAVTGFKAEVTALNNRLTLLTKLLPS